MQFKCFECFEFDPCIRSQRTDSVNAFSWLGGESKKSKSKIVRFACWWKLGGMRPPAKGLLSPAGSLKIYVKNIGAELEDRQG